MDTTTHLLLWKQKVLVANMAPHKLHVWVKLNQKISLHQKFPFYGHSKQVTFHATSAIGPAGHGTCIPKFNTKHERNDGIPYMAARRGFDLPLEPSLYSFDSDGKGHHLTSNETSRLHVTHLVTMDISNRERERVMEETVLRNTEQYSKFGRMHVAFLPNTSA